MNGKRCQNFVGRCSRWGAIALIAAVAVPAGLRADDSAAPTGPVFRPGLQQLNDETTSLYQQVDAGMIHVAIPRPMPFVRPAPPPPRPAPPQTQPQAQSPATQPGGSTPISSNGEPGLPVPLVNLVAPPGMNITVTGRSSGGETVTVVHSNVQIAPPPSQPPPSETASNPALGLRMRSALGNLPNNVAILLDDRGHVLLPMYIDRPADPNEPMRVTNSDGSTQTARFVGSDRQTNLTVLQLAKPAGTPLQWTGDRPAKGSLVLYISPGDGSGRLGLWTGGMSDFGVVVSIDGRIDGIARFGQFLNGHSCQVIAQQLVKFGSVKRASLGIFISEILPDDPLRLQIHALGSRSAMKVLNVIPGSAADKAGLKTNDLVLALAGQPVNDIPSFAAAIAARSGHTDVQILRDGKVLTISADLEPK